MASASTTRTLKEWQSIEETKKQKSKRKSCTSSGSQLQMIRTVEEDNEEVVCSSGCTTPKAKRFRIPEILTCPPAPKKRRVIPSYSSNRLPIAVFSSQDIDELFFSALIRNVST